MDLEQAIKTLEDLRRNDPVIQRGRNGELTAAFKAFWDSGPDEATFSKHTAGLLITPTMLYYMVTHDPSAKPQQIEPVKGADAATAPPAQTPPLDAKKGGKHANR